MRRFMLCCVFVLTMAGCGMMQGQQSGRTVFAAAERPVIVSREDDSYRETSKPRESFFRRVFFGQSSGK